MEWILRGLGVVFAALSAFGFVNLFYLRVHGPGGDLGVLAGILSLVAFRGARSLAKDDKALEAVVAGQTLSPNLDGSNGQLVAHWRAQGLPIATGASEDEVRRFESRYGLVLPADLRLYFRRINGHVQHGGFDVDPEGFAFWPLESVEPLPMACAKVQGAVPDVPDPASYFVFADYFQWSWAYAIRLGTSENPVIFVGAEGDVVARSFTEFVTLYVQDAAPLYPPRRSTD